MNQYTVTGNTDNRTYTINIMSGTTFIDAGLNPTYNLYEVWRYQEMFTSDLTQQIIIKFSLNYYVDQEHTILVHPEGVPKTVTQIADNSDGKFNFFDNTLGVPVLRPIFANAICDYMGLPD